MSRQYLFSLSIVILPFHRLRSLFCNCVLLSMTVSSGFYIVLLSANVPSCKWLHPHVSHSVISLTVFSCKWLSTPFSYCVFASVIFSSYWWIFIVTSDYFLPSLTISSCHWFCLFVNEHDLFAVTVSSYHYLHYPFSGPI